MGMNRAEDIRDHELSLQAESDAQLQSAGIREMRAVMIRLAKGEVQRHRHKLIGKHTRRLHRNRGAMRNNER